MSLTLQLPPDLESEIRRAAAQEGVPPEVFAVSALSERFTSRSSFSPREEESRLLAAINEGPSVTTWERFHALNARRRAEKLTSEEHEELLRLIDEIEDWNVRRLEFMVQLARLRGVPLRDLAQQMGLPAPYE